MTTVPAAFRDLRDAPFATLGTIGPDGRPHLSEVWFLHEDGEFKVSLHAARQQARDLRCDRAVSLFVLDLQHPMRYLEVRGDATVKEDSDYGFADCLGTKYGGVDLRQFDGDDHRRVKVTIRPVEIVAVDLGDDAEPGGRAAAPA